MTTRAHPVRRLRRATLPGLLVLGLVALPLGRAASAAEADDEIPGIPLAGSPVEGGLNKWSDPNDVFRVYLAQGQTFTASATPLTAGLDIDLYLFRPHSESLYQVNGVVASSNADDVPETVTYTATEWGDHYLDLRAWDKEGGYRLDYEVSGPWVPEPTGYPEPGEPNNDLAHSATLTPSPMLGSVTNTWVDWRDVFGVQLGKGQTLDVTIEWDSVDKDLELDLWDPSGATVAQSRAVQPGAPPTEQLTYTAPASGTFHVAVWLFSNYGDEYLLSYEVTGDPARTTPVVGKPQLPERVKKGRSFLVSGSLGPLHMKGTVVQVHRYRLVDGGWVHKSFVPALVGEDGRYTVRTKLAKTGRWRVRALHVADAEHVAKYSKYAYTKVVPAG